MRLDINLATRPYEDAREFWTRWGLGVGLLGLLTVLLLALAVQGWIHAGRDRHEIAQLQAQIAERDNERAKAQAYLDMAVNRSTRDAIRITGAYGPRLIVKLILGVAVD